MTLDDTLDLVVGALHRADVDFMVTGSLASSYHGMPRSTQDIDLVVEGSEAQLLDFAEAIARKGARGLPIWIATAEDVILAKLEWAKRTGSERQLRDVEGILQTQAEALDRPYLERWVRALDVVEEWQTVRERGSDDGR